MRQLFIIICSFLFFQPGVFSQTSISGKIVDSTSLPVSYAVVALLHSGDSSLLQGKIADASGIFLFNTVKPGNYFLEVSATGYSTTFGAEFKKDSVTDLLLPDFSLGKSKVLDEVTITTITPTIEFKEGNVIVNVENSALARGNSVYDLLFKLPGVSVENNSITIQGKSGVILMIDGRVQQLSGEQMLNRLKGMSAATVQKIEVLKNPPVKYDAAGTSGMINIVTKKNEQRGFNGTLYSENSQGVYNNESYGIALNYKNEKISIFTSVDGTYNTYLVNTKFSRTIQSDSGNTILANDNGYKILETENNFKLGADWYVNKSNTIGFKIDGGPGIYNETGFGLNTISGYNNTGFENYIFSEVGHNKWGITNYNLNVEHHFDTVGTVLNFSADYTNLKETDKSLYENHFYDANSIELLNPNIYQISTKSNTPLLSSKFDFIHPIDTTSTIEFGIKGSSAKMANDYLFEHKDIASANFIRDTALSTNYSYAEQNFAAYFNYSKTVKSLGIQIGLRGENTSIKGSNSTERSSFSKSYFSIFPNFSFEYSQSDDHVFQLNLNRRIDRPTFDQLNPFLIYVDQYSYYSGNPFVQPDYSNTAEFTYSFKGIITNSISYSHIDKFISDITEQNDSTKILLTTSRNIKFSDSYSYLLFIKYDFTNWYEITLNGNIYYLNYKGEIAGVPFITKGLSYDANLTNAFLLPGKTKLEITGFYRGPNLFGIVLIDPLWSVSMAVQKSFFKDRLDCTIGMHDIFSTFKFHTYSQFDNQDWNFYQTSDPRRISLSLSYNFGKVQAEEREMNSNEEEKDRLNH